MHALQTEERLLTFNSSLSWDIAKHMSGRLEFGHVVVVARQPEALLASVRKQWLKVLRQIENRRASTLNAAKIAKYTADIARMQQADFAASSPSEDMCSNVIFATAQQLLEFAPVCATMYVATPTDRETLHMITGWMPVGGVVIVYRRQAVDRSMIN
jgi:hypothetical protein